MSFEKFVPEQDSSPLMIACHNGNDEEVMILIENGANVDSIDQFNRSALFYCVDHYDTKCVDLLLKANANVNLKDVDGYTCLHLAAINNNQLIVEALCESRKVDLNALDNEMHTVIHWCVICGHYELLEYLIQYGCSIEIADAHGAYPIHYAAQMCGEVDIWDENLVKDPIKSLMILTKLIESNANVHVEDSDQRSTIIWAASSGSSEALIELFNAGADPNKHEIDGLTALHCASSRGHIDCVKVLVETCRCTVNIMDNFSCTPIFYAASMGHVEVCQFLIRHGANLYVQDSKGRTAYHCAAAKGQLKCLEVLCRHNINIWLRNKRGDYPVHEAYYNKHADCVYFLIEKIRDRKAIKATNLYDGRTLLHLAAAEDDPEFLEKLLEYGANVNSLLKTSSNSYLTSLDIAKIKNATKCVEILIANGGTSGTRITNRAVLKLQRNLKNYLQRKSSKCNNEVVVGDNENYCDQVDHIKDNVDTQLQTEPSHLESSILIDTENEIEERKSISTIRPSSEIKSVIRHYEKSSQTLISDTKHKLTVLSNSSSGRSIDSALYSNHKSRKHSYSDYEIHKLLHSNEESIDHMKVKTAQENRRLQIDGSEIVYEYRQTPHSKMMKNSKQSRHSKSKKRRNCSSNTTSTSLSSSSEDEHRRICAECKKEFRKNKHHSSKITIKNIYHSCENLLLKPPNMQNEQKQEYLTPRSSVVENILIDESEESKNPIETQTIQPHVVRIIIKTKSTNDGSAQNNSNYKKAYATLFDRQRLLLKSLYEIRKCKINNKNIVINSDLNNLLLKHYNFDIQKNCESLKDLERILEVISTEISDEFRKLQKTNRPKQPQQVEQPINNLCTQTNTQILQTKKPIIKSKLVSVKNEKESDYLRKKHEEQNAHLKQAYKPLVPEDIYRQYYDNKTKLLNVTKQSQAKNKTIFLPIIKQKQ